jgi:hypothetical protein
MSSKVDEVRAALEAHNIGTQYFKQAEEACKAVIAALPDNMTIGLGGSTTVKQIGLLDALRQHNLQVFDQYAEGLSAEESMRLRRAGLTADYYITSTNAITEDGQLVNVDGIGNRVAAQIFGPGHVFIVASTHKIVKDIPAALERIRTIAAPANAKRLKLATPCAIGEGCDKCPGELRMCNATVIIHRQHKKGRMKIFLIEGHYGF